MSQSLYGLLLSHSSSWMYFLTSALAFFLMVLHMSAYFDRCLLLPFSAISRRFIIRASAGNDILDLCGLLIALATLDALCWIMSEMASHMLSISFVLVVSRIGSSIRVGILSSLILFPFHLYV